MPTNDQDARALTYLACRIRKETKGAREWDEAGTHAVISELVGQHLPLVVERVTRHASDPEAKTPGAIRRPFVPDAPRAAAYSPPKRDEACPLHQSFYRDNCGGCAAERKGQDTPPLRPARTAPPEVAAQAIRRAREALRPKTEETDA